MKNFPQDLRHASGMMRLDATRLLLAFRESQIPQDLIPSLQYLGLALEEDEPGEADSFLRERINHTDRRFWVRTLSGRAIDEALFNAIGERFGEDLDWIGPVYRLENLEGRAGFLSPLPNVLLIKFHSELISREKVHTRATVDSSVASIDQSVLREIPEQFRYLGDYHYYVINNSREYSSYQLQKQLLETEPNLIQEVLFEHMSMLLPYSAVPNDPLFPNQWNMTRIQAGGSGFTGWDISQGNQAVVVCVLDSGCDLNHPDLQYSGPGIRLDPLNPPGNPPGSPNPGVLNFNVGHGTSCAGIVAAGFNNGIGVTGVAGNCRILPIAFQNADSMEVRNGIMFATDHGARVISMSFNNTTWIPAIVDPAIQYAFNRNVILCCSTGNNNGAIVYPATNPLVIACGASDQVDTRAPFSNFGPEISVVAPGINIPTTDILGTGGYDPTDNILNFFGTSAAAPHVAGLAALLLSHDPTLSNVEVHNIIERTADKVGGVVYSTTPLHPNGSWNNQMGYGRINVLRALNLWPNGQKINETDSTPESPAVCVFHNQQLYVFWKANDPSNSIYFSASSNGVTWPNGQKINETDSTPESPAVCVFNGRIYVFWKANDPSNSIYFSASSNGINWFNGKKINQTDSTPENPDACVFNNRLYVFWKANDPSNSIYFSPSVF
jgi:Subtilase family